jgi:hypothetical protein
MASDASRRLIVRSDLRFTGLKIFSATMHDRREHLGEEITAWIAAHPANKLVEFVVVQSSDDMFHCVTIIAFYAQNDRRPSSSATR